jgi:hypothetical protein
MPNKQAMSQTSPLSAEQRDAIRLLASGCTVRYTALALKLTAGTIRKWMKQDRLFQSELAAQTEKQQAQPPAKSKAEAPKVPHKQSRRVNTTA